MLKRSFPPRWILYVYEKCIGRCIIDPIGGECVSNRFIGMQIGAVWKLTMRALREIVRLVYVTRSGTSGSLSLPSTSLHGCARSSTWKKNLSWICFFHANGHENKAKRRNHIRERGWEESKVFIGWKIGPTYMFVGTLSLLISFTTNIEHQRMFLRSTDIRQKYWREVWSMYAICWFIITI